MAFETFAYFILMGHAVIEQKHTMNRRKIRKIMPFQFFFRKSIENKHETRRYTTTDIQINNQAMVSTSKFAPIFINVSLTCEVTDVIQLLF